MFYAFFFRFVFVEVSRVPYICMIDMRSVNAAQMLEEIIKMAEVLEPPLNRRHF